MAVLHRAHWMQRWRVQSFVWKALSVAMVLPQSDRRVWSRLCLDRCMWRSSAVLRCSGSEINPSGLWGCRNGESDCKPSAGEKEEGFFYGFLDSTCQGKQYKVELWPSIKNTAVPNNYLGICTPFSLGSAVIFNKYLLILPVKFAYCSFLWLYASQLCSWS